MRTRQYTYIVGTIVFFLLLYVRKYYIYIANMLQVMYTFFIIYEANYLCRFIKLTTKF